MSLSLRRVNVPARKKRDQREMKLGMENSYISCSCIRPLFRCSPSFPFSIRLSPFSIVPVDFSHFLSVAALSFLTPLFSHRIDKGFSLQKYFYLTIACMT